MAKEGDSPVGSRVLLLGFPDDYFSVPGECCDNPTGRQNGVESHIRLRRGELTGKCMVLVKHFPKVMIHRGNSGEV